MKMILSENTIKGERFRNLYLKQGRRRLLISLAETNWNDPDKQRRVPIYTKDETLYFFRLAIRFNKNYQKKRS